MAATLWLLGVSVLFLHLFIVQSTATIFEATPNLDGVRGDPVTSTQELVRRLLGKDVWNRFTYEVISADPATGHDVFEVEWSASQNKPVLRGNTGVSISSAFNHYLKYFCNASVTWGVNGTGDQLRLPVPLPRVPQKIRTVSPVKYRYYMNVCTVSYSSAWWDWERWQREIDWMAMNGINLPLAFTGQEYVWHTFWRQVGFTDAQLDAWFSGPAFLAWNRMGNIMAWAGPLDTYWRTSQMELQLRILKSARQFGMIPVLPGFAGFVPPAFSRLFPQAKLQRSASWGNFNDTYTRDYLLEPTDPLFNKLGTLFYKTLISIYGTDHVYNVDTYNEMVPSSNDPAFLKASNQAVYQAMHDVDPQAIFLMQGWLFHESFWGPAEIKAYLSGVPDSQMIILDLNSEDEPLWQQTDFFYGKPFIWCMLHNYGGTRGIYGDLQVVAKNPLTAKATPGTTMVGTGLTMEAIEQNPVIYELMAEMGWRSTPFDLNKWVQDYAVRRYGGFSPSASRAWKLMEAGLYNTGWSWSIKSALEQAPKFGIICDESKNATKLTEAWRLLYAANTELHTNWRGPYNYDLVDVTRQCLENFFYDLYKQVQAEYNRFINQGTDTSASLQSLTVHMIALILDLDTLLGSDPNFLLGKWIADAHTTANTPSQKVNREYNARNQVTMWGPNENINDYASKPWAGLVKDYYGGRWQQFLGSLLHAVQTKQPLNMTIYRQNRLRFEQDWNSKHNRYPANATGISVEITRSLLSKYATCTPPACSYTRYPNTDAPGHDLMNGMQTWTRDIAQLQLLCNANPSCLGFNSNGYLKTATGPVTQVPGCDFYVKRR